jgi:hypothetical protein
MTGQIDCGPGPFSAVRQQDLDSLKHSHPHLIYRDFLKDVGIEAELKLQEFGAYFATTLQGKFAGMAMGPFLPGWEPDSVLSGPYTPDSLRNSSHVNDPKLTAMLKEQRRTKDLRRYRQPGVTEDILFCQRTGSVGPPSPAPGSAVGHCTSAWRPT